MRRSTLFVLVLFILAIAVYFVLQKAPNSPLKSVPTALPTSMPTLLSGWKVTDFTDLTETKDGAVITVTRGSDGTWTRTGLGITPDGKMEQVLSELIATRILNQMPADANLADLGLKPALTTIHLKGSDGRQAIILIGATTPTQSGYYAVVDNHPAVIIDTGAVETILKLVSETGPATPTPPAGPTATPAP